MGYPDYEELRQCLFEETAESETSEDDDYYDVKDDYEQTKKIRKEMLKLRRFPIGRKENEKTKNNTN